MTMTTIEKKDFVRILDAARVAIESRNTLAILSNILLDFDGQRLTATATDLDITASAAAKANGGKPWRTTVGASLVAEFARRSPDGVEIGIDVDDKSLTLRSGRARAHAPTLPASDFPEMTSGGFDAGFTVDAGELAGILKGVGFAVSSEETRYYLNGIFFHPTAADGGMALRAVATDGHKLARIDIDCPDGAAAMPGIIVPTKSAKVIAAMLARHDTAEVSVSEARIMVSAGDETIVSKLIDGQFPDYARVIPTGNDKRATFDRASLVAGIERVSATISDKGRGMRFAFDDGECALTMLDTSSGTEAEDTITADYAGDRIKVGLNPRYAAEIAAMFGGEKIIMAMADAGTPVLFTDPSAPRRLAVCMPMRI